MAVRESETILLAWTTGSVILESTLVVAFWSMDCCWGHVCWHQELGSSFLIPKLKETSSTYWSWQRMRSLGRLVEWRFLGNHSWTLSPEPVLCSSTGIESTQFPVSNLFLFKQAQMVFFFFSTEPWPIQ